MFGRRKARYRVWSESKSGVREVGTYTTKAKAQRVLASKKRRAKKLVQDAETKLRYQKAWKYGLKKVR